MCVHREFFCSYRHLSKVVDYKSEVNEEKGGDVVFTILQHGKIPWSLFLAPSAEGNDCFSKIGLHVSLLMQLER